MTEAFREQTKGIENQFALLPAERVKEFAHQLALDDLGPLKLPGTKGLGRRAASPAIARRIRLSQGIAWYPA